MLYLFVLVTLTSAQLIQLQPQAAGADQKTYTVTGTVINAVTGEPISRAVVVGMVGRSVMTGSDGGFELSGVPAGQFFVTARKPGYFSDQEIHPGRQPAYLKTADIKDPVVVKLTPQSVITGRVTDSNGEPVENAPVSVFCTSIQDGRKRRMYAGQSITNEDGEFRLPGLRPGQYFLSAGPASAVSPGRLIPTPNSAAKGFAKIYYAGVPDRAEATPVSIAAGQHATIDFSLGAVPLYRLSVRIVGIPPNAGPGLQVFNRDGDEYSPFSGTSYDPARGVYGLLLPPGIFTIKALTQTMSNQRMQILRAQTQVSVTSDLDNIVLALEPANSIPIEIRAESTKPDSPYSSPNFRPNANVHLVPEDPLGNDQYAQLESQNSSPVFRDVEPGKYWLQVDSGYPGYVQSARCGSQDLTREMLTVVDGQRLPPIQIVLRDDTASLAVQIRSETPFRIGTVVILGSGNTQTSVRTAQAWNGSSELSGLAPGDYTIYAFEDVSALEYRNPDALSSYSSRAAHVTLAPNGKTNVVLDLIHMEE